MRRLILVTLAVISTAASFAPMPVTGRWLTVEGKALVDIAPCGQMLCGRIARVLKPRPGGPAIDVNNPDATLRTRPIAGILILSDFKSADDRWKGRIYDPESGRTYRSELIRAGGTLKVKGCIGPFCRTQEWTAAR